MYKVRDSDGLSFLSLNFFLNQVFCMFLFNKCQSLSVLHVDNCGVLFIYLSHHVACRILVP